MKVRFTIRILAALFVAFLLLSPAVLAQRRGVQAPTKDGRISEEKSGSFPVRDGQRLRLVSDTGNIHIRTQNSEKVSFVVRIEANANQPGARQYLSRFMLSARPMQGGVFIGARVPRQEFPGHLWVTFELNVPRNFQLDINTRTGNIETESTDGRISLVTGGGNITAASVGGPARLETQGGHITVQDVSADLSAISAGGHITAGNVQGDAVIHTAGGHIRVTSVQGTAQLETGGGNISLERAGAGIVAHTSGGRIDLGEASGTIRASTGGGNIGVLNVAGSTQLDSGGGSICLTKIQGAIRASTATGTITAYFIPEGKLLGPSQLESGAGDIVVYIPRELAISIDATVESLVGDSLFEHASEATTRIDADPAIPLKLTRTGSGPAGRTVRAEAALNGGGEVLRLKTATGNIRLRYSGSPRMNYEPSRELLRRQIEVRLKTSQEEINRQIEAQRRLFEKHQETAAQASAEAKKVWRERSRIQEWQRKFWSLWSGRLRVDAGQMRLLNPFALPAYPTLAKQQHIEGMVRLEVYVSSAGTVEDMKVLSGHELLARAAVDAVKQWRYEPVTVNDKTVPAVTTVDVYFRLN